MDVAFAPDGTPTVVFYDRESQGLEHAWPENGAWTLETVDSEAFGNTGPQMAYDPGTGELTVCYGATTVTKGRYKGAVSYARFARRTANGWQTENVEEVPTQSVECDLAYDPSTGYPAVAYLTEQDEEPIAKLARWDGSAWLTEVVDSDYASNDIYSGCTWSTIRCRSGLGSSTTEVGRRSGCGSPPTRRVKAGT